MGKQIPANQEDNSFIESGQWREKEKERVPVTDIS